MDYLLIFLVSPHKDYLQSTIDPAYNEQEYNEFPPI